VLFIEDESGDVATRKSRYLADQYASKDRIAHRRHHSISQATVHVFHKHRSAIGLCACSNTQCT
jgi:hypothetical protein